MVRRRRAAAVDAPPATTRTTPASPSGTAAPTRSSAFLRQTACALRALVEAVVDRFVINTLRGMPHRTVMRAIELLGTEVAPKVREALKPQAANR